MQVHHLKPEANDPQYEPPQGRLVWQRGACLRLVASTYFGTERYTSSRARSIMKGKMVPELAFYYGSLETVGSDYPKWVGSDSLLAWTKSALLFFDGIATYYSKQDFNRVINDDPVLAQPLLERGLLHNYVPKRSKVKLPQDIDSLLKDKHFKAVIPFFEAVFEQAETDSLHPQLVWEALYTALRADELRTRTTSASIQPITDNSIVAKIASQWVKSFANASEADVIEADIKAVGIDMSKVPLDEVLDFRKQHGSEYRDYAKELRNFTLSLSLMTPVSRTEAMQSRASYFRDRAEDLRATSRKAFRRASTVLVFGIAGATWTLAKGDPLGALLATGATIASFNISNATPIGASYSYVLRARNELTR